ncbi:potassium voltage-gated channel subfamily G member 1 [Pimephales promelas]|uniref:potassium voltage-gated channel subfamily G member 1 n=1 Tax=Pimephales promelas TaxID=90988 RepID=UPI001955D4FD|nr:potassium voltage-gated channel subfamily G member 1 [Pimephales promelas]XP_039509065.1 potassium voltage-gated channel subfamily G member 1 [Pimephales promelas]XP_039509066.1 potassium voltage-gated channel subfamily G member 1 [Pimephales promelas]XP_039509067.1 potassium voltage-gated channel subfamily G member 1 [Pimephales promelas]XP_039509068.1 potassium voltage-gated channel subfamily G member 1 [Pimephales promelas]XP_039509069.1 potassium voltage-gated channel subfamily G member
MTLLAGDGSDYDYSALSCTSDTSLNAPPIQEREALKGVYYKRAQRLPPTDPNTPDAPRPDDACGQRLHVIINVGGLRYQLPWTTLEDFPLSRLGQLRLCSSFDEIMRVCDDYDVVHNEFFFDRSPCAFRTILTFLRAGKLRSLREMCALSFQEELLYWGVPQESLEWCCRRRLLQRVEECDELERDEEDDDDEDDSGSGLAGETRLGRCMDNLRDMVEKPHSGLPGKIFACLSVLFVTITAINLSISTMPAMREEEESGKCSQMCYNIFIVETVCVAWFSLEFTLRFIQDRSKLAFLRRPLNLIDVIAILPYYITLVVDSTSTGEKRLGSGNSYLDKVGLVLRVLRALRILYVMRLARHSLGLQTLGLTARRCTREFGLLLLFLCVAIALFSPLLYLIENEAAATREFSSIPATYWWAVITMTTVGYGDMVPRSIPGQVVALSSILSGILLMAFPVTSIFHTFSRSYVELKQEQQRLLQRRTHFLLRSRIAGLGSNLSVESDVLFPSVSSNHRDKEE